MIIETRAVPPFQKNGYVVACETTRQAVVIDPGDEVDQLLQVVAGQSLDVRSILLTHAHVDHVTGVARAKQELQVPVYLHRDDQFLYDAAPQQAAFFGLHCDELPPIDRYYDLAEPLTFGDTTWASTTRQGTVPAVFASRSAKRTRRRKICLSAIRCSPARLEGPIFRVGITRR